MLEIAMSDVSRRLSFDNPWWEDSDPAQVRYSSDPRRGYFGDFYRVLSDTGLKRATVLMGPRRAGKTFAFMPTSLYAYTLGANFLSSLQPIKK